MAAIAKKRADSSRTRTSQKGRAEKESLDSHDVHVVEFQVTDKTEAMSFENSSAANMLVFNVSDYMTRFLCENQAVRELQYYTTLC